MSASGIDIGELFVVFARRMDKEMVAKVREAVLPSRVYARVRLDPGPRITMKVVTWVCSGIRVGTELQPAGFAEGKIGDGTERGAGLVRERDHDEEEGREEKGQDADSEEERREREASVTEQAAALKEERRRVEAEVEKERRQLEHRRREVEGEMARERAGMEERRKEMEGEIVRKSEQGLRLRVVSSCAMHLPEITLGADMARPWIRQGCWRTGCGWCRSRRVQTRPSSSKLEEKQEQEQEQRQETEAGQEMGRASKGSCRGREREREREKKRSVEGAMRMRLRRQRVRPQGSLLLLHCACLTTETMPIMIASAARGADVGNAAGAGESLRLSWNKLEGSCQRWRRGGRRRRKRWRRRDGRGRRAGGRRRESSRGAAWLA
eukprot:3389022-Rhodomonas_salina.4